MADGDKRVYEAFVLIMGREPRDHIETLEFLTAFNAAAMLAGLPPSQWSPKGTMIPEKSLDFILWRYEDEEAFENANLSLPIPTKVEKDPKTKKMVKKLVMEPSEFSRQILEDIRFLVERGVELAPGVLSLEGEPLTDAEVDVLDPAAFNAAEKYRNEHRSTANPGGAYPSQEQLFSLMAVTPPKFTKQQAGDAYINALRSAGIWPPKSSEFRKALTDRFENIWDELERGFLGLIPDRNAFMELIGQNLPEPEAEFLQTYKEKKLITEDFEDAWQRLLSTQMIDVEEDLQPSVKALLGKAYVDAAYQNPMTTKAESVIQTGVQSATKQSEVQRLSGYAEATLEELVKAGDYDRAARLIGPPPSPGTAPNPVLIPAAKAQEALTRQIEQAQAAAAALSKLEEAKANLPEGSLLRRIEQAQAAALSKLEEAKANLPEGSLLRRTEQLPDVTAVEARRAADPKAALARLEASGDVEGFNKLNQAIAFSEEEGPTTPEEKEYWAFLADALEATDATAAKATLPEGSLLRRTEQWPDVTAVEARRAADPKAALARLEASGDVEGFNKLNQAIAFSEEEGPTTPEEKEYWASLADALEATDATVVKGQEAGANQRDAEYQKLVAEALADLPTFANARVIDAAAVDRASSRSGLDIALGNIPGTIWGRYTPELEAIQLDLQRLVRGQEANYYGFYGEQPPPNYGQEYLESEGLQAKADKQRAAIAETRQRAFMQSLDPDYQDFVRQQMGYGEEAPGFQALQAGFRGEMERAGRQSSLVRGMVLPLSMEERGLAAGNAYFRTHPELGIRPPDTYADFIGKEFEKLQTQYQTTVVQPREKTRQQEMQAQQRQQEQETQNQQAQEQLRLAGETQRGRRLATTLKTRYR